MKGVAKMKTIKAKKITAEAFAPYGQFYPLDKPTGYALKGEIHRFFPDRLTVSSNTELGFSTIIVEKPEEMKITSVEYHTTTPELIMPLNDDMIVHVAPASAGTPVTDLTEAFIVPKNTMIKINTAIWHLAPLPANKDELVAAIILPVCTYINDCIVVDLKEDEQFIIEK